MSLIDENAIKAVQDQFNKIMKTDDYKLENAVFTFYSEKLGIEQKITLKKEG